MNSILKCLSLALVAMAEVEAPADGAFKIPTPEEVDAQGQEDAVEEPEKEVEREIGPDGVPILKEGERW